MSLTSITSTHQGCIFHRIPEDCLPEKFPCFDASRKSLSIFLSAENASQLENASQVRKASQLGNISLLGNASQLGNISQMENALQMVSPSQKYVGFHTPFWGRVFVFKYYRSGKVYVFFVKYFCDLPMN